jgi:hypothetical protein
VGDHGFVAGPDLPAGFQETPAQVHILGEHEVLLVETANGLEGLTTNSEEGSREPAPLGGLFAGTVPPGPGILGPQGCDERVGASEPDRWKAASRRVGLAASIHD